MYSTSNLLLTFNLREDILIYNPSKLQTPVSFQNFVKRPEAMSTVPLANLLDLYDFKNVVTGVKNFKSHSWEIKNDNDLLSASIASLSVAPKRMLIRFNADLTLAKAALFVSVIINNSNLLQGHDPEKQVKINMTCEDTFWGSNQENDTKRLNILDCSE